MLSKRLNWDDTLKAASTGDYARFRERMHRILALPEGKVEAAEVVEARADAALQTRLESFVEAWINIAIGFWINFAGNWFILPLFGFTTLTLHDNFMIGAVFTVISVARQYAIRRWAQVHLRRFQKAIAAYLKKLWVQFLNA